MTGSFVNLSTTLDSVPLRILIVDDEFACRQRIKTLLRAESHVELVGESTNSTDAVKSVQTLRPDLLVADIQVFGKQGLELLRRIAPEGHPRVVFTVPNQSASEFAQNKSLEYLIKPLSASRFHAVIESVRAEVIKLRQSTLASQIVEIARQSATQWEGRFTVRTRGRILFVNQADVDWIEAVRNYVRLHTASESHLIRESIGHLSERLRGTQFARIHRSIIVNINRIKEVVPCNSGEYIVILHSGKELSCSRKYGSSIRSLFAKS